MDYYVVISGGFLELRQTRFEGRKSEHPHDLCATARNREEMTRMVSIIGAADRTDWREIA